MAEHYFTLASLQYLTLDTHPTLSNTDFLEYTKEKLDTKAFQMVKNCTLPISEDIETPGAVLGKWIAFEQDLREYLARARSRKTGLPYANGAEPQNITLEEKVREVIGLSNPLDAEDFLDDLFWKFLDELELGHYFDTEKLQIYYFKLQILNRRAQFVAEKGRENFNATYDKIRDHLNIEI